MTNLDQEKQRIVDKYKQQFGTGDCSDCSPDGCIFARNVKYLSEALDSYHAAIVKNKKCHCLYCPIHSKNWKTFNPSEILDEEDMKVIKALAPNKDKEENKPF